MMKNIIGLLLFHGLFNYCAFSQKCGKERWPVKTLSDGDTIKIDFHNIRTSSIKEQVRIPFPFTDHSEKRMKSEFEILSLTCYLLAFKEEADGDIHLIISDNIDTMIAEIPDPECVSVKNTSRYEQFRKLRNDIYKNIGIPGKNYTFFKKGIKISLTGVGFFDSYHKQAGMARNQREIHPVLGLEVLKTCCAEIIK